MPNAAGPVMNTIPPGLRDDDDTLEKGGNSKIRDGYSRWVEFIQPQRTQKPLNSKALINSTLVNYEDADIVFAFSSSGCHDESKNAAGGRFSSKMRTHLFNDPLVPLVLRSINWILSLSALIVAASIVKSDNILGYSQRPSTLLAVVVCAVTLVYIIYITWDEYTGKPLGLRSPSSKMRLIFLDLLFIIFSSANLSLAYAQLFDSEFGCHTSLASHSDVLRRTWDCEKQGVLAALLTILLSVRVLNFVVSVLRVVERIH
ncbi:Regulator of phospholipase D SRF1 [Neolecta irregularis DAH-3]|uniref:Regulator of phospholipase D SRF1 n=1 Tax=Neolecta irregularis (strain DAH-3) TaxID=1198029 RepID=A0A1U7LTY0_NEOID|nr:Regulator of phospholipase D SRF1 [Neolecta irregularis DAH-3]|eukprot:OLL26135.1 Regulator of phospholipase D SRF1 [Neolecta irregularis DAH-3]